jgi:hypothetical protein
MGVATNRSCHYFCLYCLVLLTGSKQDREQEKMMSVKQGKDGVKKCFEKDL